MSFQVSPEALRRWARETFDIREAEDGRELALRECPVCGDAKRYRHYFNPDKGVYYCYRHGCSLSAFDLVKLVEGLASTFEVVRFIKAYGGELLLSRLPEGSTWSGVLREKINALRVPQATAERVSYPEGWDETFSGRAGSLVLNYAKKRGLPEWFIDSGRLGVTKDRLRGRLVALVMEGGRPVYAVGRAIRDHVRPKYLYPSREEWGGIGKSDVVFNLDLVDAGATVLVCEGYISALSAGRNAVATLGLDLSDRQAEKIALASPSEAVILVEEGVNSKVVSRSAMRLQSKGVLTSVAYLIRGDTNDDPSQIAEVVGARRLVSLRDRVSARFA